MYKFSAPNLLQGTVAAVKEGAVNGVVSIETSAGFIKADVSMAAIRELGLREGARAAALINAPDVLLEVGEGFGFSLSAGNGFPGKVTRIERGAVSAHVWVELPCGCSLVSDVTLDDVDMLGLEAGSAVFAAVSSNDVVVLCEG